MIPSLSSLRRQSVRPLPAWIRLVRRGWPLALPMLLLAIGNGFPYLAASPVYSDISISHYPNALYLRRMLLEQHSLPLWSPNILSGYPFLANPLSGIWYPPGWLALLFPLPFGFTFSIALHLMWGGLGVYRLLRLEGRTYPAALLGALAFEALPKLAAHFAAGHVTLLYAVPWTPWLLYASRRRLQAKSSARLPVPGGILALIFLADPRWAAYAGLLWAAYLAWGSVRAGWAGRLRHFGGQIAAAGVLMAPLALPLLQYTRLSTRSDLSVYDRGAYSLPPGMLFDLFFPALKGSHEFTLYAGAGVLVLALIALAWRTPRRQAAFWFSAAAVSLVWALGEALPFFGWISNLPGFDLLRVPTRGVFISGLALAAAAATGLDALLDALRKPLSRRDQRRARLLLTALVTFSAALTAGVWILSEEMPIRLLWGSTALILSAGLTLAALRGRIPARTLAASFAVLVLLDVGGVDRSMLTIRSKEDVLGESRAAAEYLAEQSGRFRVYSPSYSLAQQTAAQYRLELADGVDPLQLKPYADFMEGATGVPQAGYSVTLPPMGVGSPSTANAAYRPDARRLGLLNVRYVAAEFDLEVSGLELREQFGETRVYENLLALPRAWVQPSEAPLGEDALPVEILSYGPNRMEVEVSAENGDLLVLSELAYPGWQARVDGKPAEILAVDGLLRGVLLPGGARRVEFFYTVWAALIPGW